MFTFLVSQSLKNRILVLVAAAVLIVFGTLTASGLHRLKRFVAFGREH